jgi:hypothetical protein
VLMNVRSITRSSTTYNHELLWLASRGILIAGSMRGAVKVTDQALSARVVTRTSGTYIALSRFMFRRTASLSKADCNSETYKLYFLVFAAGCEPRVQHAQLQCNCTLQDCILVAISKILQHLLDTSRLGCDKRRAVRCRSLPILRCVVCRACTCSRPVHIHLTTLLIVAGSTRHWVSAA